MMLKILVVIFAMATVVCAKGWFDSKVAALTIARYIAKNETNRLPTKKEMEACREEVIKEILFSSK